ncbi:hypothetical protein NZK35_34175, partial [Stieleria sp. ICT_E10.1]|uniref:hypothetical protein n=1 Tax=Stieleria sedimenti TaxID=2976331 RepID=UPI00217FD252
PAARESIDDFRYDQLRHLDNRRPPPREHAGEGGEGGKQDAYPTFLVPRLRVVTRATKPMDVATSSPADG